MVGYTGGSNQNPSYDSVCEGDGHTEAIRIEYNETLTSYAELLEFYWKNYHGTSHFPQYKSAIWVQDDDQRAEVLGSILAGSDRKRDRTKIQVLNASNWHDAEEYHQKYMEKAAQHRMPPNFPPGRGLTA
ncbi:unnamed protein product [Polarella glacialis]|uniref:peptide-methionine (S)-S-oxide reductase n=1 Tax=Polarella glacialis TaxID=89957 RepID=A0A813DAI2_POLGL|nr:unnamed protein product [Polarella glacialis]CAE8651723.1 unnamed protein product [Polarella glacialis]